MACNHEKPCDCVIKPTDPKPKQYLIFYADTEQTRMCIDRRDLGDWGTLPIYKYPHVESLPTLTEFIEASALKDWREIADKLYTIANRRGCKCIYLSPNYCEDCISLKDFEKLRGGG